VRWDAAGRFLVGQDPFALEQHVYNLRSMAFFTGRVWPVEIALWDIIGKATGQPIYRLLGGGSDKLRAYASTGECRPTAERVDAAQKTVAAGFRAIKIRFHSEDWRDDVKTLDAVRKAVGDKIDIMVDGNWGWRIPPDLQRHRWDLRTAIAAAKAMEEYGVYDPPNWTPAERDFLLKEPLMIDSEGYVALPQGPGLGIEIDEEKAQRYEKTRASSRSGGG
jgi:D-galactarolactone cycloisomerase